MDYKKIYDDIMNFDPKIRLVTICDSGGKIMHSDHRQGVTNLLTPEESKKSLDLAVNAWKTRTELAPKIGKGKYVLAEYEKLKTYYYAIRRRSHSLHYYRSGSR
jgi:hypothetical protein